MRSAILILMLAIPMAAGTCVQSWGYGPPTEAYGFSSEDFGGSSYLGVDTRDITPDRLAQLHLKEESGVEITMVDQDAPAGKAGLKEQDVILTLNGEKVESVEQLRRMIRETPPGRVVTLGISRDGQPMSIKVPLADRKSNFAYNFGPKVKDFHFEMPALPDIDVPVSIVVVHSSMRSGLMVENLTPQLGDFFGIKDGQGVLIRSVEKGSRADKAGFRAGDVIVKINGTPIHDSSDFTHAMHGRAENNVSVSILRDKKEQTLKLVLPERKQSESMWESMNLPELDAETHAELMDFESEMAQIRPEIEEAVNRQLARVKPALDLRMKDLCKQKREIKRQVREMQRAMRNHKVQVETEIQQELDDDDTRF